jgi:hypothetical protein
VYPDLYRVDNLTEDGGLHQEGDDSSDDDGNGDIIVPQPERLQVTSLHFPLKKTPPPFWPASTNYQAGTNYQCYVIL